MKLCYRGVEYDYNPPSLEMTEREILGRYRGRSLRFKYVRHIPFPQPIADMKFRGADYHTDTYGRRQSLASSSAYSLSVPQTTDNAAGGPTAAARHRLLQEATKAHKSNIQRSLQHRLFVARSQGNEQLVHQLEQENHQLV